jgi:hypothetical protein
MDAIQNSTILMWEITLLIFLIKMGARLAGDIPPSTRRGHPASLTFQ